MTSRSSEAAMKVLDTGLLKTDPYIIVDENDNVLAQSYHNDYGEHSQESLRKIVNDITIKNTEIAELRAQLAEANGIIRMCLAVAYNKKSSGALLQAQKSAYEYLDKVKSGES